MADLTFDGAGFIKKIARFQQMDSLFSETIREEKHFAGELSIGYYSISTGSIQGKMSCFIRHRHKKLEKSRVLWYSQYIIFHTDKEAAGWKNQ